VVGCGKGDVLGLWETVFGGVWRSGDAGDCIQ
jgi:hypothetical protein